MMRKETWPIVSILKPGVLHLCEPQQSHPLRAAGLQAPRSQPLHAKIGFPMVQPASLEQLQAAAKQIRRDIVEMIGAAKSGHPGGSLSAVEILVTLYFGGVL